MTTNVYRMSASHDGAPKVKELDALLRAQRAAYLSEGPPSAEVRKDRLDRLILMLTETADAFTVALNEDFGNRPETVSLFADVAGALPDISATRRKLKSWMRPDVVRSTALAGVPTIIEKRPLGVVGIIGPWNFPVGLTTQPAASALAAGNRVMIKFSEATPNTAEVYSSAVAKHFAAEEMTVVTGGPEVGAAFSALHFDHLFFTGSPQVGALVARTAAENLVPTTLELGGKNPAVVSGSADIIKAAVRIMSARLVNGGQLCLCPDYAFVPRAKVAAFVEAAIATAGKAAAAHGGAGLVSIINDKNFERVNGLIDDARAHGADVRQAPAPGGIVRRIQPTILVGVNDQMRVAREEVFGPVLSVFPYDDIDTVVTYVNARPSPLAAYWYGDKGRDFDEFRRRVASGGMTVNDFAAHCGIHLAPFGGVGHSGWGAYHGKTGFDTLSHHRTITTSRLPVSFADMLTPPYSSTMARGVRAYVGLHRRRAARRMARHRS
ncbi:MAG: coniferyl-aldehyde dehydrogenase [Mycobacterium sp.]|jgi:coniferyl-aldehyde dehydrogenase|nr:coniferyl-aldehyde dehydrogenase [Mycobacterium sp.]